MIIRCDKTNTVITLIILAIFAAIVITVLTNTATSATVPVPVAATNIVRPPWMTNAAVVPPKTNMTLVWVEKRTIQVSTNNLDWQDLVVQTTNTVYVPLNQPQQFFRVYCGEISSDMVSDFTKITWQTNIFVSTP